MKAKIGNYFIEIMTPNTTKELVKETVRPDIDAVWRELNKLKKDIVLAREEVKAEVTWMRKNFR